MKPRVRKVKKYRHFSEEFKRSIVEEYESGRSNAKEISVEYSLSESQIYRWIYKFSNFSKKGYRIVEHSESKTNRLKQVLAENQALKAVIGEKQIKIDYLEQLISLVEAELNIDLKKNSSMPQSSTSEKTDLK